MKFYTVVIYIEPCLFDGKTSYLIITASFVALKGDYASSPVLLQLLSG
jgi:hypothetical protein